MSALEALAIVTLGTLTTVFIVGIALVALQRRSA